MNNGIISASSLTRAFETGGSTVWAVNGVDLEVKPGELLAVIGRSGSGKTTLLNLLSGLDRPTNGAVFFRGEDLSQMSEKDLVEFRRRKIGFVFPVLRSDALAIGPRERGITASHRRRILAGAAAAGPGGPGISRLGAASRHRPYELSGGEQQRVSIARALVTQPEVVFADEPTGELDTTTARAITAILREISANGTTVITATHDLSLAEAGDRCLEMVDGSLTSGSQNPDC